MMVALVAVVVGALLLFVPGAIVIVGFSGRDEA